MKTLSKIFLLLLLAGFIYMIIRGSDYKREIEEHPGKTICKYTFCKSYPKTNEAFVKYYVNDKVYRNSAGRCPEDYSGAINKYYVLKYSTIDPNKIDVDFTKEVKDEELIKELDSKLTFKYWLDH